MVNGFVRAKNKKEASKEMPWATIVVRDDGDWWAGFQSQELYVKYLQEKKEIKK